MVFKCLYKNNAKYLQFQRRYSDACFPWFLLFWRDIFRICMITTILYQTVTPKYRIQTILPYFIVILTYIFIKIWESIKRVEDKSNPHKYDAKQWCLSIIWYILTSISGLFIFPCAGFYTLHWCEDDMHRLEIGRLFTNCDDTKPYINELLKYILNNNHNEIKKRIITVNYYFTTKFLVTKTNSISYINRYRNQINYFSNVHNLQKNGLNNVKWSDIQNAGGYDKYMTISRWFRSLLLLCIAIYDVILLAFLQKQSGASMETHLFCLISIVMDIIFLPLDFKYFQLYWYCYHILPFVDLSWSFDTFWNTQFMSVDDMINDLNIMYQIMFNSMEKKTLIEYKSNQIPTDIIKLIGEFLWISLPICEKQKENKFKKKFYKLIMSFKNQNKSKKIYICIENNNHNTLIVNNNNNTNCNPISISI